MDETNPITQIDFMQAHIEALQKQLAEKDTMIDWLCARLQDFCDNPINHNCDTCWSCHNNKWRKAAQEAVKKDDK